MLRGRLKTPIILLCLQSFLFQLLEMLSLLSIASVFTAVMVLEQFGVDLKHNITDKTDNYIN